MSETDRRLARHRLAELVRFVRALERDARAAGLGSAEERRLADGWADRRAEFLRTAEDVLGLEGGR